MKLDDVGVATPWETKREVLLDVEDQLFAEMARRRGRDSKGAEDGLDFKMALAFLGGKYKGKTQARDTLPSSHLPRGDPASSQDA